MKRSRYAAVPITQKKANAHSNTLAFQRHCGAPPRSASPHVARIEGYIEALVALEDDAILCARSSGAIRALARSRDMIRRRLVTSQITSAEYEETDRRLDRAEIRLSIELQSRCEHLRSRTIPEVKRCAQIASAA